MSGPAHGADPVRRAVPADAPGIARVQVEGWRSAYRGIIADSYLDTMDERRITRAWERGLESGRGTWVAVDGDQIVGFVHGGLPARQPADAADAEIDALYVAPGVQRRGVGRALLAALAADLVARGARSVVVWALSGNAAGRAFYERLGGVLDTRERSFHLDGGFPAEEVSYRWDDVSRLLHSR